MCCQVALWKVGIFRWIYPSLEVWRNLQHTVLAFSSILCTYMCVPIQTFSGLLVRKSRIQLQKVVLKAAGLVKQLTDVPVGAVIFKVWKLRGRDILLKFNPVGDLWQCSTTSISKHFITAEVNATGGVIIMAGRCRLLRWKDNGWCCVAGEELSSQSDVLNISLKTSAKRWAYVISTCLLYTQVPSPLRKERQL